MILKLKLILLLLFIVILGVTLYQSKNIETFENKLIQNKPWILNNG